MFPIEEESFHLKGHLTICNIVMLIWEITNMKLCFLIISMKNERFILKIVSAFGCLAATFLPLKMLSIS